VKRSQSGFGLLESLVAVAILSGGMLLLLNAYNRSQSATRDHQHATKAIALIQDISERMHINRFVHGESISAMYATTWTQAHSNAPSCTAAPCNATDWAAADLSTWKAQVAQLPDGQAAIARTGSNDDMLLVMVAWSAPSQTSDDEALTLSTGVANLSCPAGLHCQLSHVLP
jgi:type IV pilus modification protein PilV